MILGFTGTRHGLALVQRATIKALVRTTIGLEAVHHGDCVGADTEFHNIIRTFLPNVQIIGHPPKSDEWRAHSLFDIELPARAYLERDRDIVRASEILLAAPRMMTVESRSGTWATICFAYRLRKPCTIVWPDGKITRKP